MGDLYHDCYRCNVCGHIERKFRYPVHKCNFVERPPTDEELEQRERDFRSRLHAMAKDRPHD